jgi:hypothetical protein
MGITGPILGAGTDVAASVSALQNNGGIGIGTVQFSKNSMVSVSSNQSFNLPANCYIEQILIRNHAGTSVSGGVNVGTAAAGAEIVNAYNVPADSVVAVSSGAMLLRWFNTSAVQAIHVGQVTSTAACNLTVHVVYGNLNYT